MARKRLNKRKLLAIIDALNFCLAGEWAEDCHDPDGDYDGALEWAHQELARREAKAPQPA